MNTTRRTSLRRKGLRLKTLVGAMLLADPARHALADPLESGGTVEFDAGMLGAAHKGADLSRFALGNPVDPGDHDVQVVVNGISIVRRRTRFDVPDGRTGAEACADSDLLDIAGVRDDVRRTIEATHQASRCLPLDVAIPGAKSHYDSGDYVLSLSIPQADLDYMARGETDPSTWETGITAARLNYSVSSYATQVADQPDYRSSAIHLDAGANLGAWRFRHRSMHHWTREGSSSQVLAAYAETDVPKHRARAVFGDFNTTGVLFDSIGLRGVAFESDERMWPDSQRGYAPEVRGIAHGNAVVTIRQNGHVIHEVNVPAGAFVIRDLYPTGYGGALDVTVTEADGRQEVFIVPYASVPQLLRPDNARFSIALGQWQGFGAEGNPLVLQATGQRGFNNLVTGYTGFQASDDYAAVLLGTGLNTRFGAFAFDGTQSFAQNGLGTEAGQSWRLSYSHFLPSTDTTVMVAAHRHATRDFWSLDDQIAQRAQWREGMEEMRFARARNQFELQLNQPLGRGSLHASASLRDFWDRNVPERHAQLSYAFNIGQVGLSLAGRWRENDAGQVGEVYASITLPLGGSSRSSHRVSANAGYARDRGQFGAVSLSGSGGREQRAHYGVTASRDGNGAGVRASANAGYEGSKGRLSMMAGRASGQTQWSASADGGLLWHRDGITLGPSMSDTVALVRAPQAAGARLVNAPSVRVDGRGFAIVPSLAPYRRNVVDIDPRGIDAQVRFAATSTETVPRAGAIVRVGFDTARERSWMLRAQREGGGVAPFGAQVRDAAGAVLGIVGQGGVAYLSGEPAPGALRVHWGDAEHQQCHVEDGRPSGQDAAALLPHVVAPCVAPQQEG